MQENDLAKGRGRRRAGSKRTRALVLLVLAVPVLISGVALASDTLQDPDPDAGGRHQDSRLSAAENAPSRGQQARPTPDPLPSGTVVPSPTPSSTPTAEDSPSPTESDPSGDPEAPEESSDPDPTDDPGGDPGGDPPAPTGGFPTMDTTGPRVSVASMRDTGAITTEKDGQVIEGVNIDSQLKIVHDDVIVRDSRVNHNATKSGQYAVHITEKSDGTCPENVVVEYIEIVGDTSVLVDTAKTIYAHCGFTLRNSRIYDVGNGVRLTSNTRLERNFIFNNHFVPDSGSHRGGVAINGGSNNEIIGNTIACEGTGCSGALVMYGDFAQVSDILIQGNLLNTTGSYCTYGGSLDSKEYPVGTHIRYLDNHFGRDYFPTCGRYGPKAGWDSSNEGNVWSGNVWHDTGEEID